MRLVVYFIACCTVAGTYMWYANTTSSTFLEAEHAACIKSAAPFGLSLRPLDKSWHISSHRGAVKRTTTPCANALSSVCA